MSMLFVRNGLNESKEKYMARRCDSVSHKNAVTRLVSARNVVLSFHRKTFPSKTYVRWALKAEKC